MKTVTKFLLMILLMAQATCTSLPMMQPIPPTPENATITWLLWTDLADEWIWGKQIESAYEKLHPNIDVQVEGATMDSYDSKLQRLIDEGTPADVWSTYDTYASVTDYVHRGLAADLTPFILRDTYDVSDFFPELMNIYTYDGKIMGIPFTSQATFIFSTRMSSTKPALPTQPQIGMIRPGHGMPF